MNSADRTFHLIAWKKGLVPKPQLDLAMAEATRRRVSLESVLFQAGQVDAEGLERIRRTRARHGAVCSHCRHTTYLLPGQQAVPCENCRQPLSTPERPQSQYHTTGRHAIPTPVNTDGEDATDTVLRDPGPDETVLEPPPRGTFVHANADMPQDATDTLFAGPPPGTFVHSQLELPGEDPSATAFHAGPDPNATLLQDEIIDLPTRPASPSGSGVSRPAPARTPTPPAIQRPAYPTPPPTHRAALPSGDGEVLHLVPRMEPYRFDTDAGTIDDQRSGSFNGVAFQLAAFTIQAGAGVVATGSAPLTLLTTGGVTISGNLDLCGEDAQTPGTGGRGGRSLRITAAGDLVVDGSILADGGRGAPGSAGAGCGGGGSGGTVLLQSMGNLTISGTISALGGQGGNDRADSNGTGAPGRIRLEDADGDVRISGAVTPAPGTGSLL